MSVNVNTLTLSDYVGLNRSTGGAISGYDHLMQSQHVILTTPTGTRVMRRTFGCDLPIDAPMNAGVLADITASAAEAIIDWEPRETLQKVTVQTLEAGAFTLNLQVEINGETLQLEGVV